VEQKDLLSALWWQAKESDLGAFVKKMEKKYKIGLKQRTDGE